MQLPQAHYAENIKIISVVYPLSRTLSSLPPRPHTNNDRWLPCQCLQRLNHMPFNMILGTQKIPCEKPSNKDNQTIIKKL